MIDKIQIKRNTDIIKKHAIKHGFSGIAIAKVVYLDEEAKRLEQWLKQGFHGEMTYMEDHFDLRVDVTKLMSGAKSVISLMFNYYNPEVQSDPTAPKISMYAYGKDYHNVIKKRLTKLIRHVKAEIGDFKIRGFVDFAPVLERDWARRAGLGWVGKHTLLINKNKGSYFFLVDIITDLELEYDAPTKDHCGSCTRCIDACPTEAISEKGYIVDGSRCISYLTIEKENQIPLEFKDKMQGWAFGCDICQQVCPWNKFSTPHSEYRFNPKPELLHMTKKEWEELSLETFNILFEGSPLKRAKFEGIKRNIEFLK